MSIAIYARVSDIKKKADGERRQDIERQVNLLQEALARRGITEFKIYRDDGKSAFTDDLNQRPAFKKLLNDCRAHWVKEIYIEDMTRFSRNLSMGLQWIRELGQQGVHMVSIREGDIEATTSEGWMKSAITLLFAEWDSRIKSEKVKSGMKKAKNLGKHTGRPKKERVGQKPAQIHARELDLEEASLL